MAKELVQYYGTGRRKSSTARVYLRPGKGRIFVNDREFTEYFPRESLQVLLRRPLVATETLSDYDAHINVTGGGETGQAGAVSLGLARALIEVNPALRATLKKQGLLTRDAREVERKKYGRAGARRRFQFSKR